MKQVALALVTCGLLLLGCRQQMGVQPRYDPLEPSAFFADGQSARHRVSGTVARGEPINNQTLLYTGRSGNTVVDAFPFPVTLEVMKRGQERFNIFCSPCHSRTGNGDGMIVRRGYTRPPSFHSDRLRQAPAGYFFTVITNGFGAMPTYAAQIPPHDRWAIIAYIRALQLSQQVALADTPPEVQEQLRHGP